MKLFMVLPLFLWTFKFPETFALRPDWKLFIDVEMIRQNIGKDSSSRYSSDKFEGDMDGIDSAASETRLSSQAANVITNERVRWINGTVPYVISTTFRSEESELITKAMSTISMLTFNCIKFQKRTTEVDYIEFSRGLSCYSNIGRQGSKQMISLVRGCMENLGDIQHEIMHALGFFHELSRNDRSKYIDINWDNIQKSYKDQFKEYAGNTFGLPYDYSSVMHYPFNAFAIDPNLPTLVPTTVGARIGQNRNLSPLDVAKIQMAYKCDLTNVFADTSTVAATDGISTAAQSVIDREKKPSGVTTASPVNAQRCPMFLDGTKCGCYQGWCWAYLNENSKKGDEWCYTQVEGFQHGLEKWATCSSNRDCSWAMTCGNDNTHTEAFDGQICPQFLDGSKCGCWKGRCWAYLNENSKGGDKWCYTQVEGFKHGEQKWASCSSDRDCSWAMTCGDDITYTGSD